MAVILYCYTAFVLVISTIAALVAVLVDDSARRADAYRVLKLVLGVGTGSGGVLAAALQLHTLGLP